MKIDGNNYFKIFKKLSHKKQNLTVKKEKLYFCFLENRLASVKIYPIQSIFTLHGLYPLHGIYPLHNICPIHQST